MPAPDSAYAQLFGAIEAGDIRPGDRLLETELAAKFGVSRTPVREAIRRLEADGIVQHLPRVGAVVRSLGQQEVVELYEMRIILESTAALMAAQHASEAEIRTLDALNSEMKAAHADPQHVAKINRRFHVCIVEAARNQFLSHSYNGLSHALLLLGRTTLESSDRVALVVEQHNAIIAALRKGDRDGANAAMREHMEASLDHRLKALHIAR